MRVGEKDRVDNFDSPSVSLCIVAVALETYNARCVLDAKV